MNRTFYFFIFSLITNIVIAQDLVNIRLGPGYGAFLNYNLNYHVADFQKLPDVPNCCPKFSDGKGTGFSFGFLFDYPLSTSLGVQFRAGYSTLNGLLKSNEPVYVAIGDTSVLGEFEHALDTKISTIIFEPLFYLTLFDKIRLNLGFNTNLMIGKTFSQYEKIIQPTDQGTFLNDQGQDSKLRIRDQYSGNIPKASTLIMSLVGGAGIELPLNSARSMLLYPEIFYQYSITPVISNYKWNINTINAGLSFVYSTTKREIIKIQKEEPEKNAPIIAMAQEYELVGNPNSLIYGATNRKDDEYITKNIESGLNLKINAVGVSEGIEEPKATLRIEEFLSNNLRPLLNYIFFDKNSSELPQRYLKLSKTESKDFSIDKLNKSGTIETYYNLLNIIGYRLTKYPDAVIKLVGCNADAEKEKGNKELSRKRAESVSNYLTGIWNIEKSRIKIEVRNLPENYSNPRDPDGTEENRRVEIYCDKWEIVEPVLTSDTLIKVSPPMIRFYLSGNVSDQNLEWDIFAKQSGKLVNSLTGNGSLPKSVDWQIDKEKKTIPRFNEDLEYSLTVSGTDSGKYQSETLSLPLEQITLRKKQESRIGDKRIDNYSLILFQFNSSELSEANQRISDFIKSRIQPNSKLLISGYTDRIGDVGRNLQLSEDRAKTVGSIMDNPNVYTRPMGSKELLYNNDLPEGRFYCRTVIVEVETPIKW